MKASQKVAVKLSTAVLLGLYLAGASKSHGGPASLIPGSMAAAPAGSSYTPQSWAAAFLSVIGAPQTSCNEAAIGSWESAESGGDLGTGQPDDPDVTHNPLNTARGEPGSHAINSDGVQAYPSWQEGLQGNGAAITNGLYGGVLSALRAGNSAQGVADAVASSPWGTTAFSASC